ncbi:MAG: hypothetical protein ACRKFN_10840, partial [Desulfitobacterium sp.]
TCRRLFIASEVFFSTTIRFTTRKMILLLIKVVFDAVLCGRESKMEKDYTYEIVNELRARPFTLLQVLKK